MELAGQLFASSGITGDIARYAGAEVIQFETNQGKAKAINAGMKRAKNLGCSFIVMLDADGQHNPDEIPKVLQPVLYDKADLVIGSRYLNLEGNTPSYRRFGQKTLDFATNLGTDTKLSDTQSGFRALKCSTFDCGAFRSEGYNVETDMIEFFRDRDLRIYEVPITVRYDVPHKHKKNPINHGLSIIGHIIGLISYRRPLLSFGVPGLILVFIGFILGGYVFQRFVYYGSFHYVMVMIVTFTLMLGLLLMTTALILNSLMKIVKMEL